MFEEIRFSSTVRAYLWALVLPFVGAVLLCLSYPPIGFLTLFGAIFAGPLVIAIILFTGVLPSLVVSFFYLGLAWRWKTIKALVATMGVSAVSCLVWWTFFQAFLGLLPRLPAQSLFYLCGVSAAAAALMIYGERAYTKARPDEAGCSGCR